MTDTVAGNRDTNREINTDADTVRDIDIDTITDRRNLVTKYWYEMRMQLRVLREFLASKKIT